MPPILPVMKSPNDSHKHIDSASSTICPRAWPSSTAALTSRLPNSQQSDPVLPKWHARVIGTPIQNSPESKKQQRSLTDLRNRRLAELQAEPDLIQAGEMEFLVHALVVPVQDSEEAERYDADVEAIAVKVATAYEDSFGAQVQDVSRPELARRAGLTDWPGFDLRISPSCK